MTMKGVLLQIMRYNLHTFDKRHKCIAHTIFENLKVLNTVETIEVLKKGQKE